MTPAERQAIESFQRLGLTNYEAKVFIALQRLGSGTARDVSTVTDVPRSQVYSVADSLEDRGLVEVQQSNPIRYRAVGVDRAQDILEDRFESHRDQAFEYVESITEAAAPEEEQEAIWTIRGRDRVDDRVVELVSSAADHVLFGARLPRFINEDIRTALTEQAAAGRDVTVLSQSDAVRSQFDEGDDLSVLPPPPHRADEEQSGRIVIADTDSILLSVIDDDGSEIAIWSADSLFASVLIQLIEASDEAPTG